jgi:hypothetical protein
MIQEFHKADNIADGLRFVDRRHQDFYQVGHPEIYDRPFCQNFEMQRINMHASAHCKQFQ